MKTKKIPLRMCIACREMKPKKEMLRIVKNKDGDINIDLTGKSNGRGAYICSAEKCAQNLVKSKLLNKAFACNIPPEIYQKIGSDLANKT